MSLWPLSLSGPEFLVVYGAGVALALLVWWLIRERQRGEPRELVADPPLDAYDVAYLRGGPLAVIESALLALRRDQRIVRHGEREFELGPGGHRRDEGAPIERAVLRALAPRPATRAALLDLTREELAAIEAKLLGAGWMTSIGRRRRQNVLAKLPLAAVSALGVGKLVNGVAHAYPVGFLALGLVATGALLYFLRPLSPRTPRGDAALTRHRRQHDALLRTAAAAPALLERDDLVLAFALGGVLTTPFIAQELGTARAGAHGCAGYTVGGCASGGCGSATGSEAGGGGGGDGGGGGSSGDGGGDGGSGGSSCGGGSGCGGCGGGGD